jgi:hypothetical protein
MEKRSRRRIRNLVALAAFKGLSENEIGCARISMMAGSDAAPSKGRIQKRKTNPLQIVKSSLQRTAGPYKSAMYGRRPRCKRNLTFQRSVRVQPCIRPLNAAAMAAGPDVIR